jgi:hypothetical protein
MKRLAILLLLAAPLPLAAKDDWQSDLHKWAVSSDTNPDCKVRYTVGVFRPDLGDEPVWNMMTEEMFKWLSKDGVKLAPSVCPVSKSTKNKADYRILFSASPMKTASQTTHGSEVRTTSQPFNANVSSQTTYSNGSTANSTATINGEQTTTVVVPTETTISRSSVAEYMYTYRVQGGQLELIGTDSVVFSRVAASGSGENAAGAELGAGIGNIIRMSGDRHRADKLYEEALKAIRADAQDNATNQQALPVNQVSASIIAQGTPAVTVPIAAPAAPSAPAASAQTSANIEAAPSAQDIATLAEQAATGDAKAQCRLGDWYALGYGLPKDDAQAAIWYRKAADQGNADAEFALGMNYDTGKGAPLDYAEAYFWLDLAATGTVTGIKAEDVATVRDTAAIFLTPADLSREQERARRWFEDHPAKP